MKLPMHFIVKARASSGIGTLFSGSAEGLPEVPCAIPPEFNGPGGGYSPEDLYALALLSCYLATFKVFAEKAQFTFSEIRGSARLIVDRNPQGITELQTVEVFIELTGVHDKEKAQKIFADSERFCLVSNAIKSQKRFTYSILSE